LDDGSEASNFLHFKGFISPGRFPPVSLRKSQDKCRIGIILQKICGFGLCKIGFTLPCGARDIGRRTSASLPDWCFLEVQLAKLYFSYSTMNAGKSTLLLQASYNYHERGMRTLILIAALDDRAGQGRVSSRIGLTADATPFHPGDDLMALISGLHEEAPISCVFVDEAQFLTPEQVWQLARVADRVHIPVMTYGLRTDFQGKLFPGSQELLAIADELREVRTICHCGRKATMVVRLDAEGNLIREGSQIDVGGNEKYVSFCRLHWEDKIRCT
jgi:thymidine kinase